MVIPHPWTEWSIFDRKFQVKVACHLTQFISTRRAEVFDKVLSKLSLKFYEIYQTNWKMTIVIWIAVALDVLLVFWAAKTQFQLSSRNCAGCGTVIMATKIHF